MRRLLAVMFAVLILGNIAFAQAKKASAPKNVPVTIIIAEGEAIGGQDDGLNAGLESFLGVPLAITAVNRADALNDAKYSGLNLDYMPLYLVHKNKISEDKFKDAITAGQLRTTDDYIVFEKQTRYGINLGAERKPNTLELFVMSQCPYGAMAEGRIIDAQKLGRIPQDIKIDVRYIVSANTGADGKTTFNSLHGSPEWEENVRQLIIKEKYPNKFWKYLEIRNKDYQSSLWDSAAEEAGINPKAFRKYWKHGLELLEKEAQRTQEAGVSGSPTFVWEGRVTTDIGGLGNIPGLQGLSDTPAQQPMSGGAPAQC